MLQLLKWVEVEQCHFEWLRICVYRDVDDPEYKPAPALLKDEMEVRLQESHLVIYLTGLVN